MLLAFVLAFAIDGLRRGHYDFPNREIVLHDEFEQHGGAEGVDVDVLADPRHEAAEGSLMADIVHAVEGLHEILFGAHVAFDEIHLGSQPIRLAI